MKSLRGYFLIIGAAIFWGISATVAKFLFTRQVDVVILTQTRITISFILLASSFLVTGRAHLLIRKKDLYKFVVLGIVGGVGSTFTYYYTIQQTNVATAILLQYLAPLFVFSYAAISGSERLTLTKIFVGILSFVGCLLAVAGDDFSILRINRLGLVSGISSACCWGFTNIWLRKVLKSYSIWTALVYSLFFASLVLMAIDPPWNIAAAGYSASEWGTFALFAIISMLIPSVLYFSGIRYLTASTAIITATMEPIIAIFSAFILLNETLTMIQLTGAAFVIGSVLVLQNKRDPIAELQP
jgi:drug/metabolite transporter (DMT)-like permease